MAAATATRDEAAAAAARVVDVMEVVGRLKTTKRAGWVRVGIRAPESVADHMYRMAVAAWLVAERDVDAVRCIKIALAHDLAEAVVGDLTPHDGVPAAEKHARERAAMEGVRDTLAAAGLPAADDIFGAYLEYEAAATREAVLVKDIDKFEMALQAYEYEAAQGGAGTRLTQFFDSVAGRLRTPLVASWLGEVHARRAALPRTDVLPSATSTAAPPTAAAATVAPPIAAPPTAAAAASNDHHHPQMPRVTPFVAGLLVGAAIGGGVVAAVAAVVARRTAR